MKLKVKVIAAVLGFVTMATMLTACAREVIKEVEVPQVVIETVVKEVPVQRVVEKEVVKEVPVEAVVEKEVFKEVEVPVEVVVEKEVTREAKRPVIVEKEVVREVMMAIEISSGPRTIGQVASFPRDTGKIQGEEAIDEQAIKGTSVREGNKPVVVEKEVIREVEKVVEVAVVAEEPPAREVNKPVVEKEVVKEVTKEVEVAVSGGSTGSRRPSTSPASTSRSGGTPPATTFRDYQRERFVSAVRDAVSTFSLDTDRTSYHLALNWARTGYRVEPDSVRAEEWINAFNYGYEPPLHSDSFAISTDVVRHPLDGGLHLARIAFQAPDFSYDSTPVNVTLVLDASGSMREGNRVDIAREAAESIRRSLRTGDRIAVVQFTNSVVDDLTVMHTDPDDRDVMRSIDELRPRGSTNVQAGLNLGVRLADRARRDNPGSYNYIILMSDGVANVDAADPFGILESAYDRDSGNPLRLITIGVGVENYNDYLLEQLAQHGNGWYRYLSDTEQARATFSRDNWLALSIPFADQTRAQVTWDTDVVRSWRIVGYENRVTSDESFTQARKEFAEIPAGAATTVFYELELRDQGRGDVAKLGDVELRWVTPSTGDSNRQHAPIMSRRDVERDVMAEAMLQMGAIVALSSDLYSSLPHARSSDSQVDRDLAYLMDELLSLDGQLGSLGAYRDMVFLMEHITRDSRAASMPSGYSR